MMFMPAPARTQASVRLNDPWPFDRGWNRLRPRGQTIACDRLHRVHGDHRDQHQTTGALALCAEGGDVLGFGPITDPTGQHGHFR